MSMHFEFALSCDLHEDTPPEVVAVLEFMIGSNSDPPQPPEHPFFEGDSWQHLLRTGETSPHIPGLLFSKLTRAFRFAQHGKDHHRRALSFRIEMLDDSFFEDWWSFAQWLAPYSATEGFVGYYREEFETHPTLIYFRNGKLAILSTTGIPEGEDEDEREPDGG